MALFPVSSSEAVVNMLRHLLTATGIDGVIWMQPMQLGYIWQCSMTCTLCKHNWQEDFEPGYAPDVVAEVFAAAEKHQCRLELGPAGGSKS